MKLPMQSLLYLVSLGLAAGSGWIFYQTMMQRGPRPEQAFEESKTLVEKGRQQTPDDRLDDYNGNWWMGLREVNWIGKVEAPPPEPTEEVVEKPKTPDDIHPRELADVMFALVNRKEDYGICIVRYKPEIDVQVPKDELGGGGAEAPAGSWAGPGDSPAGNQVPLNRGRGARNPGRATPPAGGAAMPTFAAASATPLHQLKIGDTLWPPYDDFYLARISDTAQSVFFRRKSQDGDATPPEYELLKNELQLDEALLRTVRGGEFVPARVRSPNPPSGGGDEAAPDTSWVDVEETRAVDPGHWHISRADNRMLRDDAQTIFNEDVSMRTYEGGGGKVRGVQVTRISPKLQRFGVQNGDVLLEINGVPVTSKAEALKVGKDQYKRGVRTFRAKIMTAWGKVEERVWHAPES